VARNEGRIDEARMVLMKLAKHNTEARAEYIVDSIAAEHAGAKQTLFSHKYRFPRVTATWWKGKSS